MLFTVGHQTVTLVEPPFIFGFQNFFSNNMCCYKKRWFRSICQRWNEWRFNYPHCLRAYFSKTEFENIPPYSWAHLVFHKKISPPYSWVLYDFLEKIARIFYLIYGALVEKSCIFQNSLPTKILATRELFFENFIVKSRRGNNIPVSFCPRMRREQPFFIATYVKHPIKLYFWFWTSESRPGVGWR